MFQCNTLQKHLEILTTELKAQEEKFKEKQMDLKIADEDMVCVMVKLSFA